MFKNDSSNPPDSIISENRDNCYFSIVEVLLLKKSPTTPNLIRVLVIPKIIPYFFYGFSVTILNIIKRDICNKGKERFIALFF